MVTCRAPALLFVFLLTLPAPALSQGATLAGLILDTLTGKPLEGAQIVVEGTALSSLTGSRGRFVVESITPGQYDLIVRRLGYTAALIPSLRLVPGQRVEIIVHLRPAMLDAPATRADSCALAQRRHGTQVASTADVLQGHMADFTRYLGLPPLEGTSGESELRLWEAWGLPLVSHALRIWWSEGHTAGELYRWWPRHAGPPHQAYPAELAAAHEQAGVCAALWKNGEYNFCRIPLADAVLSAFVSSELGPFERAAKGSPLPPAPPRDCAVGFQTIVIFDADYTALELLDDTGYRWYGLYTPLGAWPTSDLAGRLATVFNDLQRRYWIEPN